MIDKLPLDPRSGDNNRLIAKMNEVIQELNEAYEANKAAHNILADLVVADEKRLEQVERMAKARAAKKK